MNQIFRQLFRPSIETQRVRVWWIHWMTFQSGPFMIYHYVGESVSSIALPDDSPLWLASLAPLALTSLMRWRYLPFTKNPDTAGSLLYAGMGLSCFTCLFGHFLFPPHQLFIAILSGLCVFQFVPTYASRFYPEKKPVATTTSARNGGQATFSDSLSRYVA